MEMFTTDITGKTYYHGFNSETAPFIYIEEVIRSETDRGKKPDFSIKDWKFILECLITLNNIAKRMDDINPERVKDGIVMEFEALERITGHKIL